MTDLTSLFNIAHYVVYFTFFCIFVEFVFSMKRKDSVYSVKGTVSNIVNALIMKLFILDIGLVTFMGYMVFIRKQLPDMSIFYGENIISFLLCSIIIDFTFYWWHRAHHYFEILWMLHFVHHSDTKINMSTSYRLSFLEKISNIWVIAPAILLGYDPWFAVFCYYISSIYAFFTHSEYLKFPKFMSYVFVTPQNHIVHHLQNYAKSGMNFGIVFSIWDRLFDTFEEVGDDRVVGIKGYHETNFVKVQLDPFVFYFSNLYKNLKSKYFK